MATDFTSKLSRQGTLFAITLILLWLLTLSFLGLRFWLLTDVDGMSPSKESVTLFNNLFFVVSFVITLMISIIAIIVARLYRSLHDTAQRAEVERTLAQGREQETIRIKRQLTNNINHELKTPICSIIGYLDMILANDTLDIETTRSYVKKSFDQAERLRRLMLDLSTITRIDEAAVMIEREEVDLRALIMDVIDDTLPQAVSHNIEVTATLPDTLPISGNHSLLDSIFRNLVDNAISYSGGRKVLISMEEEATYYNFVIQDNGIGVEAKHLPHLFERFYRVDKGRSRKAGGTGLGLSIVKNAVIFHGGEIVARTSRFGGLEFTFSLKKGEQTHFCE